jgi:hypothetical protein
MDEFIKHTTTDNTDVVIEISSLSLIHLPILSKATLMSVNVGQCCCQCWKMRTDQKAEVAENKRMPQKSSSQHSQNLDHTVKSFRACSENIDGNHLNSSVC